jgi:hypothetical protein
MIVLIVRVIDQVCDTRYVLSKLFDKLPAIDF